MNIKLQHKFRFIGPWEQLLSNVTTLSKFESKINKLALIDSAHLSESQQGTKHRKFVGDAFEVFAEFLIKTHAFDTRIGISNYQPNLLDDKGVDGIGVGTNLHPATVQIKYKTNKSSELTSNDDHLSNFLTSSWVDFNVPIDDTNNMLIITNCKGLHFYTKTEMLKNKVRCISGPMLKELVDNNLPFWKEFQTASMVPLYNT